MSLDRLLLDTLPQAQRTLWPALAEFRDAFVLYGGTALALQLGHRESVDFDFFASRAFEPGALRTRFSVLRDVEILQSSPDTLTVLKPTPAGAVRLSFFGGLDLKRVGTPVTSADHGLRVASLLDLAATKIKVLQDRAELKDYLDIAAVLKHGVRLSEAIRAAMTIYGAAFNPMVSLKALVYFEDGDVQQLDVNARNLLEQAVLAVNIGALQPWPASVAPFDALDNDVGQRDRGSGPRPGAKQ